MDGGLTSMDDHILRILCTILIIRLRIDSVPQAKSIQHTPYTNYDCTDVTCYSNSSGKMKYLLRSLRVETLTTARKNPQKVKST